MKEWFKGKKVALVGNAMSLFEKSYGAEIDTMDVVVRLNKAAMLYERFDVKKSHGTRTDVWMFWNTAEYKKMFSKTNTKLMHMGHQGRSPHHKGLVDHIYPNQLYAPLKQKAGRHNNPTTGLMAIDYIVNCRPQHLYVYGFDWKVTPTFTDPDRSKEKRCPHDYPSERNICFKDYFSLDNVTWKN